MIFISAVISGLNTAADWAAPLTALRHGYLTSLRRTRP